MCGNGIRCVAKYLFDNGIAKGTKVGEGRYMLHIDTKSGVKECVAVTKNGLVSKVTVDMGKAELAPEKIPVRLEGDRVVDKPISIGGNVYRITCVSMGNPHCTVFVPSVDKLDLEDLGPKFEFDPMFPERVNVGFVEVIDKHTLKAADLGAGKRRNHGLRHGHLRCGGGCYLERLLRKRAGYPCDPQGRRAEDPLHRRAGPDDRQGRKGLRRRGGSVTPGTGCPV